MHSHIELIDGIPYIAGRNLKVRMVADMYLKGGASFEEIMSRYDLSLGEVYAATSCCHDKMDAFAREDDAIEPLLEAAKRESEARLRKMRARADSLKAGQ